MNLIDLNTDCLLEILKYCSEYELHKLCIVHPKLRQVIENHNFYVRTLDMLMVGHRNQPKISERTQCTFSYSERLIIGRNWRSGRYEEYTYFRDFQFYPTKLHLEKNYLYVSNKNYIRQHLRRSTSPLKRRCTLEIGRSNINSDIANFVRRSDSIFVGYVCGNSIIYENDTYSTQQLHPPSEFLYSVNFTNDIYVSSSNICTKIWHRDNQFGLIHLDLVNKLECGYKVLQFNDSGNLLFGGLFRTGSTTQALNEIDIETGNIINYNSKTGSIYDLKLKDDNVIFTANFDTTFRMYDRRTGRDEAVWEDPIGSPFYCLDHDGLNGVLCGTKYYGRVNLYDIRIKNRFVQLYFQHFTQTRSNDSPVYSIACDSRYLFAATGHCVTVYDFKASNSEWHNYVNVMEALAK